MPDSGIACSGLSFSWPDGTPVFSALTFSVGTGRTGLVAPNGAGKSTLLRLVAGELTPSAGTVTTSGELGYLPQTLALTLGGSVDEVLGIAPVRAAIRAIESGDADEEHFAVVGTDWDVEDRARAVLDSLGLGDVELDRGLGSLSGGQVVSLGLATELLKRPDVLLLDEPTNNLDLAARQRLYAVVESWKGCLLVVSHDRALLDRMDQIAELGADEVRLYGGNHAAYTEAVERDQQNAQRAVRNAEQEVRRQKREAQEARERAARRASNARRNLGSAGISRIHAGQLKRDAQESAGRSAEVHAQRLDVAKARLDQANLELRDQETIAISLPETNVPAGRTVLVCENVNVRHGDRAPQFGTDGITLAVRGPERIGLIGSNGSGKSTLLRLVCADLEPDSGVIQRSAGRTAYLSQRLDMLDPARSVLDNMRTFAPDAPDNELRHRLAQFLFRKEASLRPVGVLSGGERLRATLACVLSARPAPQLMLLDEPTNNLDLHSVGQLESAMNAYEGAFLVVSHDLRFLTAIGTRRWLRLDAGELTEISAPAG